MKLFGLIICSALMLSSTNSFGQISLESNFNVVHTGRNQSLLAKYDWGKFSLLAGVKYNFNKEYSFPQGQATFFKKTFWAVNLKERMGIELGTQYVLFQRKNVTLSLFHHSQLTKSHIRHEVYLAVFPYITFTPNPQSEYDYAYKLTKAYIGPVWALENNIGLSLSTFLTDNLYVKVKAGGGIMFFKNTDDKHIIITDGNWEMSEVFSFGLGWKFKEKSTH